MMPTVGQRVKCVLRSGMVAEGIVEEWDDKLIQLRSLDSESILLIPNINDIILIKIILDAPLNKEKPILSELETEMQSVYQQPSDDLRTKKMAELKTLMIAQERKIIASKLKDHRIDNIKKVEYGTSQFYALQRSK